MSWFTDDGDHHAASNGFITHFVAPTPTDFHVWRIARESNLAIRFLQDRTEIALHQANLVPLGPLVPMMLNETEQYSMIYDWLRIRSFVNPEPQVMMGELQSIRGGAPSRWSYRKIMAFRTDAFESVAYAESLDAETTPSTIFQPKGELAGR